jgi:hypothetical protein
MADEGDGREDVSEHGDGEHGNRARLTQFSHGAG